MKCILNENVALRSWRLVPYSYYIRNKKTAVGLKQKEFEKLRACDGIQELTEDSLLYDLMEKVFAELQKRENPYQNGRYIKIVITDICRQ